MSTTTVFNCRLFGGHDIAVGYDSGAGTLTILGQPLTLSTLSASLQAAWAAAVAGSSACVAGTPTPQMTNGSLVAGASSSRSAFGSDNVSQVVGSILDSQAAWRGSILQTLASAGPASNEAFSR